MIIPPQIRLTLTTLFFLRLQVTLATIFLPPLYRTLSDHAESLLEFFVGLGRIVRLCLVGLDEMVRVEGSF